jgi:GNAT superfamily N-acetyltransferase
MKTVTTSTTCFTKVEKPVDIPEWTSRSEIVAFFHETMKPYEDSPEDIERALDYAFAPDHGDFLMLMEEDGGLAGACLILNTGMGGYLPEHLLVFVTVAPEMRGRGLGRKLIEHCIAECPGDVKLHVEYDNPAKRLYERIGFTTKYAEMRYLK